MCPFHLNIFLSLYIYNLPFPKQKLIYILRFSLLFFINVSKTMLLPYFLGSVFPDFLYLKFTQPHVNFRILDRFLVVFDGLLHSNYDVNWTYCSGIVWTLAFECVNQFAPLRQISQSQCLAQIQHSLPLYLPLLPVFTQLRYALQSTITGYPMF